MHTVLRGSCALTQSTFCMCLCLNVCTLLHAVQCKCSLVVLCTCAFVCVRAHISNCSVPYGQTPAKMNTDPLWWLWPSWNNTQDIRTQDTHWQMLSHTHTNEHTSTSWPNYTEMRNEMETNLPREPANLEGLKDTLAHRTHTHLHTYVSGYLDYQNIMFRYDIIWKRNLSAQVKAYLTLSKLCHCIKLVW